MSSQEQDLLATYAALNLPLCYWERVGSDPKGWKGPQEKGWNDPSRPYPLSEYNSAKMNLGLFTGIEIAPGRFIVDVDFDWAPGLDLAGKIIPSTSFAFGRKGKKLSHAIFTVPERLGITKYCDFDDVKGTGDVETFVELRGGNYSHQTMIAPSLHSPDVRIELVVRGAILHVETRIIQNAVLDYAIACLLLKRIPGGLHHDGRKALAGFLLRAGFDAQRVVLIGEEVCRVQASKGVPDMSSKDVSDMALVVRTTVRRIEGGKKAEGGPTLADYVGGDIGRFLLTRLNKWLGRDDDFIRNADGMIIKDHQDNIRRAVGLLGHELSYDEFSDKLLVSSSSGDSPAPLEDRQMNDLYLRIDERYRFRPTFVFFEKVIRRMGWDNAFHPVKEYLDALKWDGTPRINTWLTTYAGAEDSAYLRAVSSILLIAAVRRIYTPGCKYDELLVLESGQGLDKSSALRALCPKSDWFSDDLQLNLSSQRMIESTLGKWIIEASELAGKRKTEIEQLKANLSRQIDGPARMAYAHLPVERPRQFVMIGTTNSAAYLTDPTGGRRFWPVQIKAFDVVGVLAIRDQLWAEAVVREKTGESIRLPKELWPDATVHQEKRREIDPWEDIIRNALLHVEKSSDGKRRVTTSSIWTALGIAPQDRDRLKSLRISEVMQRLAFVRTRVRPHGGDVEVGYISTDEMAELSYDGEVREPGSDDEAPPF